MCIVKFLRYKLLIKKRFVNVWIRYNFKMLFKVVIFYCKMLKYLKLIIIYGFIFIMSKINVFRN